MKGYEYIKLLVEEIHSVTAATIDTQGRPQTRIIDMMHWDEEGIYFLTAKGKNFYSQLQEQKYLAISASKDKKAVSISGFVKNIGKKNLDLLFEKNPYMKEIYPGDMREALEVFCLYEAQGEFFDISNPSRIVRESIVIGDAMEAEGGYLVGADCDGCGLCESVCPQHCISTASIPIAIDHKHCLHCGRCAEICPKHCIQKRG